MNIDPFYLIIALALAIVLFALARKFDWENRIAYHYVFVIVGLIGIGFFTYSIILHFNYTYLMINILLLLGIIQKIFKIILINKGKN
jgi:hypothetical protein